MISIRCHNYDVQFKKGDVSQCRFQTLEHVESICLQINETHTHVCVIEFNLCVLVYDTLIATDLVLTTITNNWVYHSLYCQMII